MALSEHFAGVRVQRARVFVVDRAVDGPALRARLDYALAALGRGDAERGILCVRRLRAARSLSGVRPGGELRAWADALREALDDEHRGACRPALGFVPAAARAVRFADADELLACAASDLVTGTLTQRWWWPSLLAGTDVQSVAALWQRHPEAIGAAMQRIAVAGHAVAFVRRLPPELARGLARSWAAVRGLSSAPASVATPHEARGSMEGRAELRSRGSHRFHRNELARWLEVAPEAADGSLQPLQALLLASTLVAVRAPALAHTVAFRVGIERGALPHRQSDPGFSPLEPERPRNEDASRSPGERPSPERREPPLPSELQAIPRRAAGTAMSEPQTARAEFPRPGEHGVPNTSARAQQQAGAAAASIARSPPILEARTIATRHAGLFFLVNLALALGFYADGFRPSQPGLALPLADWLALLGLRFTGPALRRDPLWAVLAELSGRSPEIEPGAGCCAPDCWRVPIPTPEAAVFGRCVGARLQLRNRHGVVLLDVPRRSAWMAQARAEAAKLGIGARVVVERRTDPRNPRRSSATRHPSGGRDARAWATWIERWVLPLCAARLNDATGRRAVDGRAICSIGGQVALHPTAIEVRIALDDLPLELRLAGVDRDPGWVPALGRSLRFRFECDEERLP